MEKGRVYKSTGSWYLVKARDKFWNCRIKGKLRLEGIRSTNPVAVGDVVKIEITSEEKSEASITGIENRRNFIVRKSVNLSKRTHVLAANLDQAFVIASLAFPKTHVHFIDRFLVTAEAYAIPAVVVFNKTDIYQESLEDELEYYSFAYRDAGYQVLWTSAESKQGISELAELLKDKTTLLSGNSGVGKSSLVNLIEPELNLKTGIISEAHEQGQHTTTFAEMFDLNMGGAIIDTPGIRGFGLVDMQREEIGDYFPEIFKIKSNCRFHNCMHLEEPGCAVKEAVENHQLAPFRYDSYLALIHGLDEDETYRNTIYE